MTDAPRPAPSPSASERFARIIEGLCRVVAASSRAPNSLPAWGPGPGGLLAGPVIVLIWTKLRRATARFAALVARVRSGALPSRARPRTRHRQARSAEPVPPCAASPRPPRLPTSFGWLIRAVPAAACSRSQLQHLLSDPEIAALLSAAPQIGRVLRPLCHMLAIQVPKSHAIWQPVPAQGPIEQTSIGTRISEPVHPDPGRPSPASGSSSPTAPSRPPGADLFLPPPASASAH